MSLRSVYQKTRYQLAWARRDGFRKFAEEKELHPIANTRREVTRAVWRARHGTDPGTATPVWLLGVQRSGTNLLTRSLKESMEIAVYSENHRKAFVDFRLRDDATIDALIARSRHPYVLFKPLCDIHRAPEFLEAGRFGSQPSKVIWAYRAVDGRVRSTVARFGDVERNIMALLAAGEGDDRWQAQGLGPEQFELIRSFDWERESVESAAALLWYLRNDLLFRLGVHDQPRVTVVSYETFVADPPATLERLARFLGLERPLPVEAGIRRPTPPQLELNPKIRSLCDELEQRLAGLVDQVAADPDGRLVPGQ